MFSLKIDRTRKIKVNFELIMPYRMKTIVTVLFSFTFFASQAQYYYNDIIGTLEVNRQMKNYIAQKVRTVTATGYDQRGSKAGNFSEYQEVRENGRALKTSTITDLNKIVIFSRYDSEGRIISMNDSSGVVQSVTTYEYDAAGRISRIKNTATDSSNDFTQTELHHWYYTAD